MTARYEKRVIPTRDLRPGHCITAPGFGLPTAVRKVGHRADGVTLIGYDVIYGSRTCRKWIQRKTAGKSTILVPVEASGVATNA